MNILIYGIGGVGGYFGGKLATTTHHTTFFARGKHLKAIQENGLEVKSMTGDFHVKPDLATQDLDAMPKPDFILLCVKSWQVSAFAKDIIPYLKPDTMILPLQNGVDNPDKLMEHIPKKHVLSGLCKIISFIDSPGKIKHPAFKPIITFGEVDNKNTQRIQQVKTLFDEAGLNTEVATDIEAEVWKKFLFICTISGIGGLTRVPIGKIRASTYLYKLMQDTAQEILAVAQAKNVNLEQKHIAKVFEVIDNQDPETTASTQRDIMEGKPSELENFNGYIVNTGAKLGVDTPVNKLIYECLKPMEEEART